jgi:hypothetical protein
MKQMDKMRTLAVVLAVAGILALAYGGFSYTEDTHEANIGSMHMSIENAAYQYSCLGRRWHAAGRRTGLCYQPQADLVSAA